MAPVSTPKGHKDCIDLPCTPGHTLSSHACLFLALPVWTPVLKKKKKKSFCKWNKLEEEFRKEDGKCACSFGV